MDNLNSYDQIAFEQQFKTTPTYSFLQERYQRVWFEKFLEPQYGKISTPRQQLAESWASAVPWYYLNYLNTDQEIVDLGCGYNFFKPYFANLTGVGAETDPKQVFWDLHDFVDDDFFQHHKQHFQSVFSICALHYHPMENIRKIGLSFCGMLQRGGRGFLTLNSARLQERSVTFKHADINSIEDYVRQQFQNWPYKIVVFDVDLSVQDAWLDGNIRLVFEG